VCFDFQAIWWYKRRMSLDEDLAQIDDRNRLRRESSLPQLEIDSELQRLKAVRVQADFERYFERERHRFCASDGWSRRLHGKDRRVDMRR
jgi:hypothetical protein